MCSQEGLFCKLPYFGYQSEKLRSELVEILCKHYSFVNFKIVLVNPFSVGSFFRYKDRLPLGMLSSVVYEFSCAQSGASYIGSTIRQLCCRVAEHTGRSVRTGAALAKPPHSSVRSHCTVCGCSADLTTIKVLGRANNQTDLRILESLYIHKHRPTLNDMQSAHPLYLL